MVPLHPRQTRAALLTTEGRDAGVPRQTTIAILSRQIPRAQLNRAQFYMSSDTSGMARRLARGLDNLGPAPKGIGNPSVTGTGVGLVWNLARNLARNLAWNLAWGCGVAVTLSAPGYQLTALPAKGVLVAT